MSETTICTECKHYVAEQHNPVAGDIYKPGRLPATTAGMYCILMSDLCRRREELALDVVTGQQVLVEPLLKCHSINDGDCEGYMAIVADIQHTPKEEK